MFKTPKTILSIDGRFLSFNELKIIQKTNNHHQFKIILDNDVIEIVGGHTIDKSKEWLGKTTIITTNKTEFSGIITDISLDNKNGHCSNLIIKGYSPTILLKGQPHYTSWTNKTLKQIVTDTLETLEVDKQIYPTFKETIDYQSQYNENHFQFLQRLAKQYNQWFYYDGLSIIFGKPTFENDPIYIEYGADVNNLELKIQVKDHKQNKLSYNASQNNYFTANSKNQVAGLNELSLHAFNTSKSIFKAKTHALPNINLDSKYSIDNHVEDQQSADSANLHVLKGKSSKQDLTIGGIINVNSAKINEKSGFDIQSYGKYIIISIAHKASHNSYYKNTFTAIPAGIAIPKSPKVKLPQAKPQIATVTDNSDNEGRVKVRFQWQSNNEQTAWLRVMSNNAGSSDHHKQNRGQVFIPEINDQVMVGFEHNNPNFPFVLGSLFHGQNGVGGKIDNNIKSIITRSGHVIEFNDTKNAESILITDKNKNSIYLDTANKSIKLKAYNKIDLAANDITLNATNNLVFNSANNAEINISNNFIINTMTKLLIFAPYFKQTISGFMHLFSGKALINSLNSISIESKEVQTLGSEKVFIHSDKKTVVNSKGTAEMHGTKKNSFTNTAEDAQLLPPEEITLAVVEFRTEEGIYNGEFGFDWLRIDEPGLTIEPSYESIIEGGYFDGVTNLSPIDAFIDLQKEYDSISIKPKVPTVLPALPVTPRNYFVPYLNLYSKPTSETVKYDTIKPPYKAKLRVLVEIEEDIDKLEFDYDKNIFEIDKPVLADKTACAKQVSTDGTIEITCNKLITSEEKGNIKVYAYPKGSTAKTPAEQLTLRKLAGKIKVGRNDIGFRKKVRVVLINVITNITGSPRNKTGSVIALEKEHFRNTFYHVLTYVNFYEKYDEGILKGQNIVLDLSSDRNFKITTDSTTGVVTRGKYIQSTGIKKQEPTLNAYLRTQFFSKSENAPYAGCFFMFAFDELAWTPNTMGRVEGINKKSAVLYKTVRRKPTTMMHEALHGYGLYHTHIDGAIITEADIKYTYPRGGTDNIISYARGRKTTWKWQWGIFKPK